MSRIPDYVIKDIVSKTDIGQVVADYVRLEKRGSSLVGLCPFHNEKTGSFNVNIDKGFFYCFGCKKGGDAITFIKEIEKCSYVEAIEILAEKAGVKIEYDNIQSSEDIEIAKKKDSLYELYERLTGTFRYFLTSGDDSAMKYITARKISTEVNEKFRLGYAPKDRTWLYKFLLSKSYSKQFLAESGLFSKNYEEVCIFSDRLIFPITDIRGRVIAFGGRTLSDSGPKYLNSPETIIYKKHDSLYGLSFSAQNIRASGEVILCEGYMDTLSFHSAGVNNAVAPLGTALTETQVGILKRYAKTVILCFDNDAAGLSASERAINIIMPKNLGVKAMKLGGGKDPSEILERYGPEQLKNSSKSIITIDEFILGVSSSMLNGKSSVSIADTFIYLFKHSMNIPSQVARDEFINKAAQHFNVNPASVKADYLKFLNGQQIKIDNDNEEKPSVNTSITNSTTSTDVELIIALIANIDLFESVRTEITVADFENSFVKDIFITMEEFYRCENLTVSNILEKISSEELRIMIMQRISSGTYSVNQERFLKDAVIKIKERTLKRKKQGILSRIRNYSSINDDEELSLNDLLYEKMSLDQELFKIKEEKHERK